MIFYRFTNSARRAMSRAILVAQKYGHKRIGTEHILHGLSEEENSKASNILANLRIKTINICSAIEKLSPVNGAAIPTHKPKLPQTRRAKKVIKNAIKESRRCKSKIVGTEQILLGILRDPESSAFHILASAGISPDQIRNEAANLEMPNIEK